MGVTASRCEAAEAAPEVRLGVDGGGGGGDGGPRVMGVAGLEGALAVRVACVGPGLPQARRACATPEEGLRSSCSNLLLDSCDLWDPTYAVKSEPLYVLTKIPD